MKLNEIAPKLGLLLVILLIFRACTAPIKWKEEVQLSNGKTVVVERESIYESGGGEWASNRSGTKIKAYYMKFPDPSGSGKTIEWRTTKVDSSTYPEIPLVLDTEAGKPVVYSLIAISAACEVYSKYVYQNDEWGWSDITLPEHFEQHTTNLLFGSTKDIPRLVSKQESHKRNNDPRYREALRQVGPNLKICGG